MLAAALASDPRPVPALQRDHALDDMRSYLATMKPQSPSDSLRLLRNAFPNAPLGLRVAACGLGR